MVTAAERWVVLGERERVRVRWEDGEGVEGAAEGGAELEDEWAVEGAVADRGVEPVGVASCSLKRTGAARCTHVSLTRPLHKYARHQRVYLSCSYIHRQLIFSPPTSKRANATQIFAASSVVFLWIDGTYTAQGYIVQPTLPGCCCISLSRSRSI